MKQSKQRHNAADRPVVTVTEHRLGSGDDDWYTPKVLKEPPVSPLQVSVTLGRKGAGRVRCDIEEGEWERRHVEVRLIFEKRRSPFHSTISGEYGDGEGGTFTRELLDRLIRALEVARSEAEKHGLFTPRPTPGSLEELLAADGGIRGGTIREQRRRRLG